MRDLDGKNRYACILYLRLGTKDMVTDDTLPDTLK